MDTKFEGRALYQANFSLHIPKKVLEIAIVAGVFVAILIIGLAICCCCRFHRKKKGRALAQAPDVDYSTGPKRFSYIDLSKATNKFDTKQKLGEGGFGDVYQGKMPNSNEMVAVKKFKGGSSQGEKEFASEVKVISMLRHKNLVQLKGWCHENRDLLLVYDFMPNRSLDFHLFRKNMALLTWLTRYKIVVDLASALHYLQDGCDPFILHRDIKSSNIMLDSNFNAKLGDFGLARLTDQDQVYKTTVPAGTLGYLAPEVISTGKVSKASDAYSFGVVTLEVATGRRPPNKGCQDPRKLSLVEWVWDLYGLGSILDAVDARLNGGADPDQARRMMVVGLWCCHPDPGQRPSMKQALAALDFEAPEPILAPTIPTPSYFSPQMNMYMMSSNASMDTQSTRSSAMTSRTYASSSTATATTTTTSSSNAL